MRVSYEGNYMSILSEFIQRPSFYYITPVSNAAPTSGRLDDLIREYYKKEKKR